MLLHFRLVFQFQKTNRESKNIFISMYGEPMEEGNRSLDFTVVSSATPTTKE